MRKLHSSVPSAAWRSSLSVSSGRGGDCGAEVRCGSLDPLAKSPTAPAMLVIACAMCRLDSESYLPPLPFLQHKTQSLKNPGSVHSTARARIAVRTPEFFTIGGNHLDKLVRFA